MKSMTGYGRCSVSDERLEITIEIHSVNRKNLDIAFSLPREWQGMERELSGVARKALLRGKVNVQVQVVDLQANEGLSWDDAVLSSTLTRLRTFAETQSVAFEPDAGTLVRLITALGSGSELPSREDALPLVLPVLEGAIKELTKMRAQEGESLRDDLKGRLDLMESWMKQIGELAVDTVEHHRDALFQRLQKLDLELDMEDERLLKELSLFADRCDTSEELTRMSSHFEQFRSILQESGSVGRKLDFLCQEMHREINTTGSKANNIEVTRLVIECKNELERIREQVQNIE